MKNKFYQYIQTLQDTITSNLETVDGKATFKEDKLLLLYSMPLSVTAATLKTVEALQLKS
ncbi:hypothetical protein CJ739_1415 [Mariniflexile rhizosphaerae]|nr:hypothetical protein CJ739_1415 [Mariniflexile sp. TRM1-10]PLB20045.1 MAG: Coproporphyrinogen III oxidase, aerobic [Flavobacteriaceae bacterium FS1-H7996/R]